MNIRQVDMSDATDSELVQRIQSGSKEEFRVLVERYQRRIYGTIYKILQNQREAEDATQEVFLKAYRSLSSFKGDSAFSTWLYRIAMNHCMDVGRKLGVRQVERWPEPSEEFISPEEGPEQATIRAELRVAIEEAVRSLPTESRVVVALRLYSELPFETIGDVLSIPSQTAKMRFHRAKQHLRAVLAGQGLAPVQRGEGQR